MSTPVRIQRKRTKGWRAPENTVYVGRPGRYSNPLKVGMWKGFTAADAVRQYRAYIARDLTVRSYENAFGIPPSCDEIQRVLGGKNLMCWCALDQPCHADVLLEIANRRIATGNCQDG